ncbi:GMC oxidoreductase [Microbacterium enclense]|uniref:GMC oxidoreductase n=1 Tax=Microbacterium enclense TaxID=993073 RepID=UPI003D7520C0
MNGPEVHVVVVGSGPVGATYARALLEGSPRVRVTMFERGPVLTEPVGMNVRNIADPAAKQEARRRAQGPQSRDGAPVGLGIPITKVVEGTYTARGGTHLIDFGGEGSGHAAEFPAAAVSTAVGGQGAQWTCATPRPGFSELIPFIPGEEWDALILEAEGLLHTTHRAFDRSPIAAALQEAISAEVDDELPEGYGVGPLPVAGDLDAEGRMRWAGTDVVFGSLLDPSSPEAARFTLRSETAVTRVVVDEGHTTGVLITPASGGEETFVAADIVVVAADAIRTPQLLWASGIRPRALGRYLSDHPGIFSVVAIDPEKLGGRLSLEQIERERRLSESAPDPVTAVLRLPFSEPDNPYSCQVLYMHDSPLPIPDDHPLAHNPWGYANVGFGIRKFARYEDWIEFDDTDLDWAGMPNVTIHYEFTDREEAELEGARRRQRQVAGAIGSFIPGGEPAPLPYGASLHYKGTMRIGETDDGTSVCDPWSRVWSIDNLYLGGNGTIPTNTVVNPTLTSVAIALRGARGILSSIAREEEAE